MYNVYAQASFGAEKSLLLETKKLKGFEKKKKEDHKKAAEEFAEKYRTETGERCAVTVEEVV